MTAASIRVNGREGSRTRSRLATRQRRALIFALAAALLGALYATLSAYWGAGGAALLDTIGGALEREARARAVGVLVVVWITVILKLFASGIGLLAVAQRQRLSPPGRRRIRRAAWVAAVILVIYGGVLTLVGLLVQADLVHASAYADHEALRWHALLWDPWFLAWGLTLTAALALSRQPP